MSRRQITLAVKALVTLAPASGSLNFSNSFTGQNKAQKGSGLHRMVQNELAIDFPDYEAEFFVRHSFALKQNDLHLSGRIDGIFHDCGLLEEIKTTTAFEKTKKEYYEDPFHPHLLQLKLYGLMLFEKSGEQFDLHMRLINQYDSSEFKIIPIDWSPDEIRLWLFDQESLLNQSENKAIYRRQRRHEISEQMAFPFDDFRPQQKQLMKVVGEIFELGAQGLIQAPTGIGKTASTIFPALLESLRKNKTLFFLTPKNSQHLAAQEFVQMLQSQDQKLVATTLTAKEKICFKDETICQPEYCEYAREYFDKLNQSKVVPRLAEEKLITREKIEEYARHHEICPFELSLECTLESDIVIGDYNYVYAPNAALVRFFDDPSIAKTCNILVDEAHNLYQRALDYFSPEMSFDTLKEFEADIKKVNKKFHAKFREYLQRLAEFIASPNHQRHFGTQQADAILMKLDATELFVLETEYMGSLAEYVQATELLRPSDPFLKAYSLISDFTLILKAQSDAIIETAFQDGANQGIRLTCGDASEHLKRINDRVAATVTFSATLKPFQFYGQLSGFDPELTYSYEFGSPFPKENRLIRIIPSVKTTYRDRNFYLQSIAKQCLDAFSQKPGNYIVFFPAFSYLKSMESLFYQQQIFQIHSQEANMEHDAREDLMQKIRDTSTPKIILAVQGGIFSEGVDFPGSQVIGTAIIGPAIPAYTCERKALRDFYENRYNAGQEYAYIYPAMCKVIQSVGRVIRTETDRGIILLFGQRFIESKYVSTYPSEWYELAIRELFTENLIEDVQDFWQSDKLI